MERIARTRACAHVDGLARVAVAHRGVPQSTARHAAEVTARWARREALTERDADRRRVDAYFWGVVRRRALAGEPGHASYRSRCVADTLAADMLAAGHDPERVVAELSGVVGAGRAREAVTAAAA